MRKRKQAFCLLLFLYHLAHSSFVFFLTSLCHALNVVVFANVMKLNIAIVIDCNFSVEYF